MSIVDAIEKAKRLAQERAQDTRSERRRPESAPARGRAFTPRPESLPGFDAGSASDTSVVRAQFPVCPYDSATCSASRVLVDDADALLQQSAASPYRMLRTRVLQRSRANGWTMLGLTSPGPGEGKSVTALNLAITIAREGNNDVFLLDLDMRNPSVCRYLGATPPRNITDVFLGKAEPQEALFSPGIPNLFVAGSTEPVSNASELLSSGRLEELLSFVRGSASNPLIVVDLPPAVNTDDALVVAPRMDAIFLVVSEGVTRRDGLEKALGLLSEFTLGGVILNQSMESLGSDYYGAA